MPSTTMRGKTTSPAAAAPATAPPRPAVIDLREPAPAPRRAAVPRHAHDEDEHAFAAIWAHVLRGTALGCLAFAALAVLLVLVAPPLSGLDFGGIMVFVAASAGFGLVPGTIFGIGLAERALRG